MVSRKFIGATVPMISIWLLGNYYKEEGWGHEILDNVADGCIWFLKRGSETFSDPANVYENQISFSHQM